MRIGLVGCGYTADGYLPSMKRYPHLEVVAATDRDQQRASQFCNHHSVTFCPTLEAMLADPNIDMIVNLTSSSNHFEVSKACLEAGKHLYSEKPVATTFPQARELVELAKAKGLYFSLAPCSLLGETAQTLWRALRAKTIGKVRLVYAELDDGPFHLAGPHLWRSPSGAPYDYGEEFQAGVTVEHAAYYVAWFAAFFGPARTITSFSSCLWPERQIAPDLQLQTTTPDFSVACITFESGVVARLTCGLVAPFNHVMRIVGETGVLRVDECWNFSAPVYLDQYSSLRYRAERYPITKTFPLIARWLSPGPRTYPPVKKANWKKRNHRFRMDYARGISDLAVAIAKQRPPKLAADFALHVTEVSLAIQNAKEAPYQVTTTFQPLEPLDDAELKEYLSINW